MAKIVEVLLGQKAVVMDDEVPDTDEAKLKFYLHCVSQLLELEDDILCNQHKKVHVKFTDYKSKTALERNSDLELLLIGCTKFCPHILKEKVMFIDEDLCGESNVKMFEVNKENLGGYTLSGRVNLYGKVRTVHNILVCKNEWIENYWKQPVKNLLHILAEKY